MELGSNGKVIQTQKRMKNFVFATLSLLLRLCDFAYSWRFMSQLFTIYTFGLLHGSTPCSSHESFMGVLQLLPAPVPVPQSLPGPAEIFIASLFFNKLCTLKLSRLPDFSLPNSTAHFPSCPHLHHFTFLLLQTHQQKQKNKTCTHKSENGPFCRTC